jgi:hypothetical protein
MSSFRFRILLMAPPVLLNVLDVPVVQQGEIASSFGVRPQELVLF